MLFGRARTLTARTVRSIRLTVSTNTPRTWKGANTVFTVRDTLLKQPKFRGHYVLSFEPLLDKYAANLAVRSKAVMRAAAGRKCLLASPTTAPRLHPPGGSEGAGRSSTSWSAA